MNTKSMRLADLVEDLELYPRNRVDDMHVMDLVRAIQAGATLPPIVADKKSKVIVDGIHRRRALMKVHGDTAESDVELMTFDSKQALFIEAVRRNATHGRRLERQDQTRIVLRLHEMKVDDKTIAASLSVTEDRVRTLAVRMVYAEGGGAIPAKQGLEHLRGTELSNEQVDAMHAVRSGDVGRLALEITRLLDAGLADLDRPVVLSRLWVLQQSIANVFAKLPAHERKIAVGT